MFSNNLVFAILWEVNGSVSTLKMDSALEDLPVASQATVLVATGGWLVAEF
jgi:hypothetical protein